MIFSGDHSAITIPQQELDQLRKDIRDEILSHVGVSYSSELLEVLSQQRKVRNC